MKFILNVCHYPVLSFIYSGMRATLLDEKFTTLRRTVNLLQEQGIIVLPDLKSCLTLEDKDDPKDTASQPKT